MQTFDNVDAVTSRPDFTGTWKLIRGESDFAFLPPPRLRVDTITHRGPDLLIRTHQKDANGKITVDRKLTIDGEAVDVTVHNRARRIRAWWDDTTLVLETKFEVSGHARRIEDRLSLDATAKWLTIERSQEQPGGTVRQRLQLRRERAPPSS